VAASRWEGASVERLLEPVAEPWEAERSFSWLERGSAVEAQRLEEGVPVAPQMAVALTAME
jgi:hypothetical protein